jgi:hypothetical protein
MATIIPIVTGEGSQTRLLDNAFYPRKAVAKARESYREYCMVNAVPTGEGQVALTVTVFPEHTKNAREVLLEFWNFLLDTACEIHMERT